jgi:Icc-related predicted phosphoesterase
VLSVSDTEISFIHSQLIRKKFGHVDIVIACGDLSYSYLDYIISMLDIPLFYVRGNHDHPIEFLQGPSLDHPFGGVDLHRKLVALDGLLLAGVEGSVRYKRQGQYQYTQREMWGHVLHLVPALLRNRLFYGRYLDVFVTHASPWGIHDKSDLPHHGIKAFRWFLKVFQPEYHFHGHIHTYRPDTITETQFGNTRVLNAFGYRVTELALDQ